MTQILPVVAAAAVAADGAAAAGGYSRSPCTRLPGGSALHSSGGTSHPSNS